MIEKDEYLDRTEKKKHIVSLYYFCDLRFSRIFCIYNDVEGKKIKKYNKKKREGKTCIFLRKVWINPNLNGV